MARKMRDSGVEWIGEVPEWWSISRVKNVADINHGQDPVTEGAIPVYGSGGGSFKTCGEYKDGPTVLLGRKGTIDAPHYVEGKYWNVDTAFDVKTKADVSLKWFYYLAICFDYKSYVSQTAVPSMTQSDYRNMAIPCPSYNEQRRIADYLDEKCAAIDGAVGELKRGIEDCKAWKKAIIFEAVTGKKRVGFNAEKQRGRVAERQMRDSGIPWIGEIPEGWEVSRVKNECINLDSLREPISAENRENKQGLYDYYGASGVIDKIDDYNVDDTVLLIGEDGANLRMRNLPLVYKATGKFWVNNHAHILKPKEGRDYDFMAYALEAGDYNDFITGSAQPKLSQANLMAYPIVLPHLTEQQAIADYLDEKCAAIDALVAEKEKLIADLDAYKKSLIFELVTGKRDLALPRQAQDGALPRQAQNGEVA